MIAQYIKQGTGKEEKAYRGFLSSKGEWIPMDPEYPLTGAAKIAGKDIVLTTKEDWNAKRKISGTEGDKPGGTQGGLEGAGI